MVISCRNQLSCVKADKGSLQKVTSHILLRITTCYRRDSTKSAVLCGKSRLKMLNFKKAIYLQRMMIEPLRFPYSVIKEMPLSEENLCKLVNTLVESHNKIVCKVLRNLPSLPYIKEEKFQNQHRSVNRRMHLLFFSVECCILSVSNESSSRRCA